MEDLKNYALKCIGVALMVTAAIVGAATCGTWYGQNHAAVEHAR